MNRIVVRNDEILLTGRAFVAKNRMKVFLWVFILNNNIMSTNSSNFVPVVIPHKICLCLKYLCRIYIFKEGNYQYVSKEKQRSI